MDAWFFLLPLTAALGNLGLLVENFARRHRLNRTLLVLYSLIAGVNVSAVFMLLAEDAHAAMAWLFLLRHFLFFLPAALLAVAAVLSGRKVFSVEVIALTIASAGFLLAADVTYITGSQVLVREMMRHSWGWFPVLETRALLALGVLFGSCLILGCTWILAPRGRLLFGTRILAGLYGGWLVGVILNAFALRGMDVFPLGNGVDALVSLVLSAYLHKKRPGFFHPTVWSRLSLGAACASAAMLAAFIVLAFLPASKFLPLLCGAAMAGASAAFLHFLSRDAETPEGALEQALLPFGLSKQELRICELVAGGYTKQDILIFLNIADGTLRNHLIKIYEKTIHKRTRVPEDARDKLQRLTVFLHKLTWTG